MSSRSAAPASFRDNAGFVYFSDGQPYRHVNRSYRDDFNMLKASGLYRELTELGLMVKHDEVPFDPDEFPNAYAILKPERVPMVSYPYEWSFSQLREAALCTLEIQFRALQKGMSLKDASSYNIQFLRGLPTLIDTLSLERYVEGEPWIAYKQFCQHFLGPLALMANVTPEMSTLLRSNIDGVPLRLTSKLLPFRTKLNVGLMLHIHAHAGSQKRHDKGGARIGKVSKLGLLGLIDSLRRTIEKMDWRPPGTEWGDYYENTNYSQTAMDSKKEIVREFLADDGPKTVWDIGANTGTFSRIAAERAEEVVAWDLDPVAVDQHYAMVRMSDIRNILPLVVDLTNPSPALGWAHVERDSFLQRSNADMVLALALVHHLAIGNNVPLGEVARFFASLAPRLVIEFVPKSDSQVQRLLMARKDIFSGYNQKSFEQEFGALYVIKGVRQVADTERMIYSMERRPA
jgi:ribosomal protein L11 methylase PrmA